MDQKTKFKELVKSIDCEFSRTIWKPERIRREFGRRTIEQILNSKEIHYFCCLERHYLTAYKAVTETKLHAKLVSVQIKRPFQTTKLGTAIEIDLDDEIYTYVSTTQGNKLLEERYPSRRSHSVVEKVAFVSPRLDLSWFDVFGIKNNETLGKTFPSFKYESYLTQIIRENSEESLRKIIDRIKKNKRKNPEIYF